MQLGKRCQVVAELSANHGGSLERACRTIQAAVAAGADAVKIQTYTPGTMTIDSGRAEFVCQAGPWKGRTLWDLYQEAHTPWDWHPTLFQVAKDCGVPLFSTPFDSTAVDFLESLDCQVYKIASFELNDWELLERVAKTRKPVIASTGMATLDECRAATKVMRNNGAETVTLLKCTSAYPANSEDMNLMGMATLRKCGPDFVGLSDHSTDNMAAIAAVSMGAAVIEKHVTLGDAATVDGDFSLMPWQLKALVNAVRRTEVMLGNGQLGPKGDEVESRQFRRSLFVVAPMKKGDAFTRYNVRAIRPGHGLPPYTLTKVLGAKARRDIDSGTPLSWELLGPGEASVTTRP